MAVIFNFIVSTGILIGMNVDGHILIRIIELLRRKVQSLKSSKRALSIKPN